MSNFLASDSISEDDILEVITTLPKTRSERFLETVPNYDEETFLGHFRVSRDVATKTAAETYSESPYYKDRHGHYGKISAMDQKKSPLLVGDKDADPELMRYLGARLVSNYPLCGSPPAFVVQACPRAVLESLEKRGFSLLATDTVEDHLVWVLGRPRVPEDDQQEIKRTGPNDKMVQVGGGQQEKEAEPATTPRTSTVRESSESL